MDEAQHEDPQPEKRMGWYPDPDDPERGRWWDGKQWAEATQSRTQDEWGPLPDNLPVIKNWKPAPGFSFLGLLANYLVWSLALAAFGLFIASVIQAAIVIVYAIVFYRSYFTEKPIIKSSRAISFLNYAVSSIVFGWYWNRNLKKAHDSGHPRRGVSYIVAIVTFSLVAVYCGWFYYLSPSAHIAQNYTYDHATGAYRSKSSNTNKGDSLTQSPGSSRFTDGEYGVSFSLPAGWTQKDFIQERQFIRWKATPKDGSKTAGIVYGAEDGMPGMNETAADDFREIVSSYLDGCTDEKVERVNLGGSEYWKVTGSGTYPVQGTDVPARMTAFLHLGGGNMHVFQYMDFGANPDRASYADFESLVSSATYK